MVESSASLRSGSRVDHYRVTRLLGRGGFGDVYLARDTQLGRRVALKVIHPDHLGSKEAVERFLFEARATARFAHPHIVTIYGVGEHQGSPYVALEYLQGRTLRQLLREERSSLAAALRMAKAVAEALEEAHGAGILHRDLKPENVFLPRDGRLRVLDFGLAKKVEGHTPKASGEPTSAAARHEAATAPTEAALPRTGDALGDDAPVDNTPTLPPLQQDAAQRQPEHHEGQETADFLSIGPGYLSSADSGVRGTPYYMSPEQWAGEVQGPAVDLWALGVVLYELLVGAFPFKAKQPLAVGYEVCDGEPLTLDLDETLPLELRELVQRLLSKEPSARPSAAETVSALEALLNPNLGALVEEQGPFRGLRPFGERHAGLYFGREAELAAFLEELREQPRLAVVGPSGAGKSSFVAAGVVPRLREQGPLVLLRLRPGGDPFVSLATMLCRAKGAGNQRSEATRQNTSALLSARLGKDLGSAESVDEAEVSALAGRLAENPGVLGLELRQLTEEQQVMALLFVDQLEELYTQVDDAALRQSFTEALYGAADDAAEAVRVVVTLRDDFLGRVAEGRAARGLLSRITVLRSPDGDALRTILQRSVETFGYRYDDEGIVDEMIAAIDHEPASLPLLSFAGRLLWERRQRGERRLLRSAYEAMGGVAGALATHADAVISALTPNQVEIARQLLLRLVTAEGTRRTCPRGELVEGLGEDARVVLTKLVEARLLTSGRRSSGGAGLELTHETLITRWAQLARWIDESREERVFLAEVGQAAELWERRGARDAEVWSGEALEEALRNLRRCHDASVPELVRRFVSAGEARDAELRRSARRRRSIFRGAVVGALVALIGVSVTWSVTFRRQAKKAAVARDEARRELVRSHSEGAALALSQGSPRKARALLREALERGLALGKLPERVARQLRLTALSVDLEPLQWRRSIGTFIADIAFSPSGGELAVAGDGLILVDVLTGRERRYLENHQRLEAVAYHPDGEHLVVGDRRGELLVLRRSGGKIVRKAKVGARVSELLLTRDTIFIADKVGLSSQPFDGSAPPRRLFRGHWVRGLSYDQGISFFESYKRLTHRRLGAKPRVRSWPPRPKQMYAHAASSRRAAVVGLAYPPSLLFGWPPPTKADRRRRVTLPGLLRALAFHPRGRLLASGAVGGQIAIWDAREGRKLVERRLPDRRRGFAGLAFSPDGERLVAATSGGELALWRVGMLLQRRINGHRRAIQRVAVHPRGESVVSSGEDGVWLWDGTVAQPRLRLTARASHPLSYDRGGERVLAGGRDGVARIWDASSGRVLKKLHGHGAAIVAVAHGPRGRYVTASKDGVVFLWSSDGKVLRRIDLGTLEPTALDVSPDGKRLVVSVRDKLLLREIDLDSGAVKASHPRDRRSGLWLKMLRFDQAGALLAHGVGGSILVDGEKKAHSLYPGTWVLGDRWGRHLYTTRMGLYGPGGTLLVQRRDGGPERRLARHRGVVNDAREDRRGRLLVTGAQDATLRLWRPGKKTPQRFVVAVLREARGLQLFDRHGVRRVTTEGVGPRRGAQRSWEKAMVQGAVLARRSADKSTLCLLDERFRLQLWDLREDQLLQQVQLSRYAQPPQQKGYNTIQHRISRLGAYRQHCALLGAGQLWSYRPGKAPQVLAKRPRAVGFGATIRVQQSGGEVVEIDPDSGARRKGAGLKGRLLLELPGWHITSTQLKTELIPSGVAGREKRRELEVGSGSLASLSGGPGDTLLFGTLAGLVELWHIRQERTLLALNLHGPVVFAEVLGHHLYAISELGDVRVVDIGPLVLSPCALLRRIWREAPLAWGEDGLPRRRPPPAEHRCAQLPQL